MEGRRGRKRRKLSDKVLDCSSKRKREREERIEGDICFSEIEQSYRICQLRRVEKWAKKGEKWRGVSYTLLHIVVEIHPLLLYTYNENKYLPKKGDILKEVGYQNKGLNIISHSSVGSLVLSNLIFLLLYCKIFQPFLSGIILILWEMRDATSNLLFS